MSIGFTVILPVYNGEKTIERAILSVLKQSYKKFCLYIVNDGSTDSTLKICNQYANKDNRIKICSKKNGGLSSARNKGVKFAIDNMPNSKIIWLDADDELSDGLLEHLKQMFAEYKNIDAVFYNYNVVLSSGRVVHNGYIDARYGSETIIDREQILKKIFIGDINNYMWAFAADVGCYNGIFYPEGKRYEDMATLYKIAANFNIASVTNFRGYNYYYDNPESISKNFTTKDARDLLCIISEVGDNYKNDDFKEYAVVFQSIYLTNIIISLVNNRDNESTLIVKEAQRLFGKLRKDLKMKNYVKSRYALKILLMKFKLIIPIYKIKGLL